MATFNVYVISHARYNDICTQNHFEYCTYVVRKSQEQKYKDAGVKNILAIDDEEINSLAKVTNYLIENAPEDVICILDDDITAAMYRIEDNEKITPEQATMELERIAQIIYDLKIGYGADDATASLKFYDRPFKYSGLTGGVKFFNRSVCKARWNDDLKYLSDMDFQLNELLFNRITLIPIYFRCDHKIDTNEGGNNDALFHKTDKSFRAECEIMSNKWGRYFQSYPPPKFGGRVNVKR